MPLRKNKKRDSVRPPSTPPVDRAGKLAGIPVLHPKVETRLEKKYGFVLSWMDEPDQKKGFLRRLLSGPGRRHRLVLDPMGRRTVELIDGKRTVAEIASALSSEFGGQQREVEDALFAFLGQLMAKNVICTVDERSSQENHGGNMRDPSLSRSNPR
jgi:hypothetical protein